MLEPNRHTEFSVYLDQRPGQLAGVLDAAAAAGVEIHAVAVGEFHDKGLVRLIGSPTERLRTLCEALADTGVGPIVEAEVLSIAIQARPAALRDVACALADARVNLLHVYMAPATNATPARCILAVDNLDLALATITSIERHNGHALPHTATGPEPRA